MSIYYDIHRIVKNIMEAADDQAIREGRRYFNEDRVKLTSIAKILILCFR